MTILQLAGPTRPWRPHAPASPSLTSPAPISPTLAVLTTEAEVEGLRPEWDALWQRVADASPFISPGWLWSWWRHLGGGALRVFTARADGRLVAVLPMFVWDNAGVRRLLPLGISVSDSFDLLAEPAWLRPVQELLGPALGRGEGVDGGDWAGGDWVGGDWDLCELHEVPQDSALLWLDGAGLRPLVQRQSISPVLDLAAFAARGNRSAPVRKLRRARKRAETLGPIRLERIGPDAPPRVVQDAMEQLFALHTAQWRARGEAGVLAGSKLRAFHQDVAAAMAARGTLHLHRLHVGSRVGSTVAGIFYGFLRGRRAYAYATGTDPALSHIGPGTLLIGAAIDAARAAGARRFDFLRGQEAYKYDWGAVDQPTMQVTLALPSRELRMDGIARAPRRRSADARAERMP